MSKKVTKSFKVKNPESLTDDPRLEFLLQLMMAANAMRSAIRWVYLLDNAGGKEEPTDRFQAMVVGAGFCAEAMHLIKRGANEGFVNLNMLNKDEDLVDTWKMCVGTSVPTIVRKIYRLRGCVRRSLFADNSGSFGKEAQLWQGLPIRAT